MAQYIEKSALLTEIENLLDNGKYHDDYDYAYRDGNNSALYALKNKLDTLEVKEADLEEEIDRWQGCEAFPEGVEITPLPKAMEVVERTAKHFFDLGLFSQLTWQDIKLISEIGEDFMNSEESDDLWKDEEVYYTAILNKLKDEGRNHKTERQITHELEQKGEEGKSMMIRWTGDNLQEVISHVGLYEKGFEKWFHSSWEEYEKYVHEHGDTIKIFNQFGEHLLTAHVGDTIVKEYSGLVYVLHVQKGEEV